jgi:hypothetical protein
VIDDALGKALFVIFSKAALSCWEFDVLSGVGASDRIRFWAWDIRDMFVDVLGSDLLVWKCLIYMDVGRLLEYQ